MSETYTLNCIKCQEKYDSSDPDPYYCTSCKEVAKSIAKEIDAKMATRSNRPVKNGLQEYEAARGGSRFPNIKSLGITL